MASSFESRVKRAKIAQSQRNGATSPKRCKKGKACGGTCIANFKLCLVSMSGEISSDMGKVSTLVSSRKGKGEAATVAKPTTPKPTPTPTPKPTPAPAPTPNTRAAANPNPRNLPPEKLTPSGNPKNQLNWRMLRYGTDPTAAALAVSGRGSGEKEGIASQRDANNFLKARGSNLAKYMRENGLGKGDPIYIGDLLAKYGFKPATDEELNRPATGSMIALPAPKPRQPAASPRRIKNR